jgi:hypothetical protein
MKKRIVVFIRILVFLGFTDYRTGVAGSEWPINAGGG